MGNCQFEREKEKKKTMKRAKSLKIENLNQRKIANKVKHDESALSIFDQFDNDRDGFLSLNEVIEFVKHSHTQNKKGSKSI